MAQVSWIIFIWTYSIWAGKLHWLDKVLLYIVTNRNTAFSGTSVTCYMLSFGSLVVNPVHFLLTGNIKRGTQGIIKYFYYLIQNINVNEFIWFVCRISTILMQCLKIYSWCVFSIELRDGSVNLPFITVFKVSYAWTLHFMTALILSIYLQSNLVN